MIIAPSVLRCCGYALFPMLAIIYPALLAVSFVVGGAESVRSADLPILIGCLLIVPFYGLALSQLLLVQIDEKRLVREFLNGFVYKELTLREIKLVRFRLSHYKVSCHKPSDKAHIRFPAAVLLRAGDQRELSEFLDQVLPEGHPLNHLSPAERHTVRDLQNYLMPVLFIVGGTSVMSSQSIQVKQAPGTYGEGAVTAGWLLVGAGVYFLVKVVVFQWRACNRE